MCVSVYTIEVLGLGTVLLHNGGFFNACTMKRCLHRKVDFKTNAPKMLMFQHSFITIFFKIKANSLQVGTSHRTLLVKVYSAAALSAA